jgi:NAD(P)-dependent dehydrogenase (short-subunit alcohol dehydrogenase family)
MNQDETAIGRLFDLTGEVALVTGAGRGFGRAFSQYLAQAGAAVATASFNGDAAAATAAQIVASGGRAIGIQVDVRSEQAVTAAVERTVETLGGLTILVNNAGINTGNDTLPEELPLTTWDSVLATNVTGYFLFSRAAMRPMTHAGHGKIINIASAAAARVPRLPGRHTTAYTVSKAAVIALTRCLALEWAQHNICVNSISPTFSNTGLIKRDPAILQAMIETSPFKRLGETADLAGMLLYLASRASDFTTGQDFLVDGGCSI